MASSPVPHVLLAAIKMRLVQISATSVTMTGPRHTLGQHLLDSVVSTIAVRNINVESLYYTTSNINTPLMSLFTRISLYIPKLLPAHMLYSRHRIHSFVSDG